MSNKRKAVSIYEEDSAITLLKPFSGEYNNQLFVICEDAYGEVKFEIKKISELRNKFSMTSEEFDEIIKAIL